MRGIDTNVLVRYVTRDSPEQAAIAHAAILEAEAAGERLYLPAIVLCELVWVLQGSKYRYGRRQLARLLESLLEIALFDVQHRAEVQRAIEDYASGSGDFADHLIGRLSERAGCRDTLTFDSDLAAERGFTLLGGE